MNPEDIENREFLVSLRGYARDEVDSFKADVARAMRQVQSRARELASTLDEARSEASAAKSELDSLRRQFDEAKQAPSPPSAPVPAAAVQKAIPGPPTDPRTDAFHQVALETEKILMAAEEVAEELHEKAMRDAAGIVTDARLRAEKIFAEVDNAKRGAQQELERIRESRSMIASQMEDIGRRLSETVARLRVPVESPQRQAVRARLQAEAQRGPESPDDERHSLERQTAERQAAMEREAAAELQRRAAERRAPEPPVEAPAKPAPAPKKAVERPAPAASQPAPVSKPAPKAAPKAAPASAAVPEPPPVPKTAPAPRPEVAPPAKPEAEAAAEMVAEVAPVAPARASVPDEEQTAGEEGSSLSQLLDEIRRTRQTTKPAEPAKTPAKPAPAAAAAAAAAPAPAPAAVAVAERKSAEAPAEPAAPDPMLELRSAALGDLPVQASRRLKRLLQEDHNDLLDRLRTRRGKGALDDNLVPMPEQFSRFQSGLSEALSKAFAEGRKAAGGPGSADPVKAVSNLVARQVVNPLRAEISKAVQKGLEAQDTPTAIAERASDVFRVWKGVRTEMLGEGIVYAAFNQGLVDGFGKNKKRKQWVLSEEMECPSDICARNVAAGPVALQSTFPSGHLTPPAHGGCACTLKSV